jgi:hypothetical protein
LRAPRRAPLGAQILRKLLVQAQEDEAEALQSRLERQFNAAAARGLRRVVDGGLSEEDAQRVGGVARVRDVRKVAHASLALLNEVASAPQAAGEQGPFFLLHRSVCEASYYFGLALAPGSERFEHALAKEAARLDAGLRERCKVALLQLFGGVAVELVEHVVWIDGPLLLDLLACDAHRANHQGVDPLPELPAREGLQHPLLKELVGGGDPRGARVELLGAEGALRERREEVDFVLGALASEETCKLRVVREAHAS